MEEFTFSEAVRAEFEVLELIGHGGMAQVFRARQRSLDRMVALKVLRSLAFTEAESRARFEQEKQLTGQLRHPNVVTLYGHGVDQGLPYLVLELVEGETLRDLLVRSTRMGTPAVIDIGLQIAGGLAAAHALSIVHRDLKPENILVDRAGVVKIADFGLAQSRVAPPGEITQAGIIVGTPGYLAPEVIRGGQAGPGSDLFALGVIMFEMMTGELPVSTSSAAEMMIRYVSHDLPRVSERLTRIPAELDRLLTELLRREPERRPATAAAVVAALTALRDPSAEQPAPRPHTGGATRLISKPGPPRNRAGGHQETRALAAQPARPRATGMIAAGVLLAVLAGAWSLRPRAGAGIRVIAPPRVVAGMSRARIAWTTDWPVPSRVRVWREGAPEDTGALHPAAAGNTDTGDHTVLVTGLTPGSRYRFRVLLPAGSPPPESGPLESLASFEPLVSNVSVRYTAGPRLAVALTTKRPLTAGLQLEDGAVSWAPRAEAGAWTLEVPVRFDSGAAPLWLRIRELEADPASPAAPERWRAAEVPSPQLLGAKFLARASYLPAKEIASVRTSILRRPRQLADPGMSRNVVPGPKLVAELSAARKRELRETYRKDVTRWFSQTFELDLPLFLSAVPLLFEGDRTALHYALYERLMLLSEIDAAAEMVLGEPLLGIAQSVRSYISVVPAPLLAMVGQPVEPPNLPAVQALLKTSYIPILNHLDFAGIGLFGSAGPIQEMVATTQALSIPDPGDPDLKRGFWLKLGRTPRGVDLTGRLRVALRATNLAPDYALWLRFGATRRVLFRCPLASLRGHISYATTPDRASIERYATVLAGELPAGFLTAADTELTARLECFPESGDGDVTLPLAVWLLGIVMAPGPVGN